jgi:uncharacterized protein YidB (DUF937 family)
MGIFDSVAGALGQMKQGGGQDDIAKAVAGLFGGSAGGALAAGQAETDPGIGAGLAGLAGLGGLTGLVQKFEQAGLASVVQSWISTGPNLPISAEQLGQVLGSDAVKTMAQQAGIDPQAILGQLSGLLPDLVDKLTPDGVLPQGGQLGPQALQNLTGLLGGLGKP